MSLMSTQLTVFEETTILPLFNTTDDNMDRNNEIYDLYINGSTLQSIGNKFQLTRQRIQQLLVRIITKKTRTGIWNGTIKNPDHVRIKDLVSSELEKIQNERTRNKSLQKLQKAQKKGIVPEKYTSTLKYAHDVGLSREIINELAPDIPQKIRENMPVGYGGKKWSRSYLKCRKCGTSSIPHHSYGYCEKCFPKTDIFKDMQAASRLRNMEKWKPHQMEYLTKYYDRKSSGGKRDAVFKRDNYSCISCGITESESINKYGEHLRILHLGNKSDHDINNMATACRKCCLKYIQTKQRQ
jgi:5-methylcytosine-specific restriction endonuclease McrA